MKLVNECKDQEKASDDDAQAWLKDYSPPSTPAGKCLMACMHEKIGTVSK